MRSIDADALLKKVEKIQPWEPYLGKYAQGIRHCMELVSLLIKDAPTIEPSAELERPKGYMKIKVISAVDGKDLFCEKCDTYCLSPLYKFCPKCGVEFIGVRGEQNDE